MYLPWQHLWSAGAPITFARIIIAIIIKIEPEILCVCARGGNSRQPLCRSRNFWPLRAPAHETWKFYLLAPSACNVWWFDLANGAFYCKLACYKVLSRRAPTWVERIVRRAVWVKCSQDVTFRPQCTLDTLLGHLHLLILERLREEAKIPVLAFADKNDYILFRKNVN